jgi:hypothetical protein
MHFFGEFQKCIIWRSGTRHLHHALIFERIERIEWLDSTDMIGSHTWWTLMVDNGFLWNGSGVRAIKKKTSYWHMCDQILQHVFLFPQLVWQGGQIGRCFANWKIVYFGQFFLIFKSRSQFLGHFCPWQKLCINVDKRLLVWLNFGRFFCKLTWSPWRTLSTKTVYLVSTYITQRPVLKSILNLKLLSLDFETVEFFVWHPSPSFQPTSLKSSFLQIYEKVDKNSKFGKINNWWRLDKSASTDWGLFC